MFANALFLAIRNLGTFKLAVKGIAEVGTTGRYDMLLVSVQRVEYPHAHFTSVPYIPTAWVSSSVCYCQGILRPRIANKQKPDTPLFFCSKIERNNNLPEQGYHQAQMITKDDIQLVQLHCSVSAHLSVVLCHSDTIQQRAESVLASCELSSLLAVEACLCLGTAWCYGSDMGCGAGCQSGEAPKTGVDNRGAAEFATPRVFQVLQFY